MRTDPATNDSGAPQRAGEGAIRLGLAAGVLIHLPPLPGLLGAGMLQTLYGVAALDPALVLLLQHRALLFGLLAAFAALAVWRPALRGAAFAALLISMLSFLALYALAPAALPGLDRIALGDALALPLVAWGGWRHARA